MHVYVIIMLFSITLGYTDISLIDVWSVYMLHNKHKKIGPKSLYYSTGTLAKFRQKWLGKIFPFL